MSLINNNVVATGFPVANGAFDLERSPGNALARSLARIPLGGDDVRFAPALRGLPGYGLPDPAGPSEGAGFSGSLGGASFGALIGSLLSEIASIFGQFAALVGAGSGNGPTGASGQYAFAQATASSTGDPHESFAGTGVAGGSESARHWDSMTGHDDLLSSDSFAGGYRVSTTVTAPSASGVTMNAHVGVATDGGTTQVGLNADGSYEVRAFGRPVDLVAGRAVRLDRNESVTLGADRSLTIHEDDGSGASIETTLRRNGGGGVDVTNVAHAVDLGGYLVTQHDDAPAPIARGFGGTVPTSPGLNAPDDRIAFDRANQGTSWLEEA